MIWGREIAKVANALTLVRTRVIITTARLTNKIKNYDFNSESQFLSLANRVDQNVSFGVEKLNKMTVEQLLTSEEQLAIWVTGLKSKIKSKIQQPPLNMTIRFPLFYTFPEKRLFIVYHKGSKK